MTKCIDNNYMLNSNRYFNNYSMSNSNNQVNNCCCISNNNQMNNDNCCSNNTNNCDDNNSVRSDMLKEIMSLDFALTELQLYLNTHPEDEKALCLYKKYAKELRDLKEKYQKVYGPLTKEFPCNKWRWLEEPWPWEGGII